MARRVFYAGDKLCASSQQAVWHRHRKDCDHDGRPRISGDATHDYDNIKFVQCIFENADQIFDIDGTKYQSLSNMTIESCVLKNATRGFICDAAVSHVRLSNNIFDSIDTALYIGSSAEFIISSNNFYRF